MLNDVPSSYSSVIFVKIREEDWPHLLVASVVDFQVSTDDLVRLWIDIGKK